MMKKKTILLVDDVALFIQLQKSFLSRDLFEIRTARSGEQALRSVRSSLPDLVLLDLYMPDMNGDTVSRELKNDPLTRDVPIIIVSSEGDEDAERMCRLSGCDDFIHKPIRRDLLLEAVEKQLKVTHRRHVRVVTNLFCTVRANDQTHDARIRTFSQSGAFVEMGFTPALEETLAVNFSIPSSDKTLELKASVRWTGKLAGDQSQGAGVEFLETDYMNTVQIKRYVEQILEQDGKSWAPTT